MLWRTRRKHPVIVPFSLGTLKKISPHAYPAPVIPALGSIAPAAPKPAPACPGTALAWLWPNRCSNPTRKPLILSSYLSPISDPWSSWNALISRRKCFKDAARVRDASGSFVLRERARYDATRVDAPPRVEIATEV